MDRTFLLSNCIVVAAFVATASQAADAGCEMLAGKSLADRQLWVKAGGQWLEFDSVKPLPAGGLRKISFAYVVRPTVPRESATGAIVIKSGRKNVAGGIRGPDTVRLVRDLASSTAYCEIANNTDVFKRANVRKKAYDEYHDHDYGAEKTSGGAEFASTIGNFHLGLKGAQRGQCVRTDASEDLSGQWTAKNMRSQFSFDESIVDGGMSAHYVTATKIAWNTIVSSALAGGSDGFNSQRAEIKSYEIKDGVACVKFFASVASQDFIIRVNDLGARMVAPFSLTEQRWSR